MSNGNSMSGVVSNGEGSSSHVNDPESVGFAPSSLPNGSGSSSSGNGHANGHGVVGMHDDQQGFRPLYEGSQLDRTEFVRITMQSLKELGYESSAKSLEAESGVTLEHTSIVSFRKAVLSGDWKNAERLLLDGLKYGAARLSGSARVSLAPSDIAIGLRDPHTRGLDSIKFLLHQQRYLELLEARQTRKALSILRDRLAPLNHGSDRLHQLSSLVICATKDELRSRAGWEGTGPVSRRKLLQEVESAVSPLVMIPSRRLPELLEQAQLLQKTMDPFFNLPPEAQMSLYVDHQSDRSVFPTETAAILTAHSDEVWHVSFSHNGSKLASAGQDRVAIIWSVGATQAEFRVLSRLGPHSGSVTHVAWSPDDSMLLTTTSDGEVNVWDVEQRTKKEYREHIYSVGTGAWLPDGKQFVTGGMDGKIVIWNLDGTKRHSWLTTPYRVSAVAVSPDGQHLVATSIRTLPSGSQTASAAQGGSSSARAWPRLDISHRTDEGQRGQQGTGEQGSNGTPSEEGVEDLGGGSRVEGDERHRIHFYDLERQEEVGSIYLWDELTSVTFSDDSRHVLFNQRPNESQIWDVAGQTLLMRLNGHRIQKHVIRSCFGGVARAFVISGSEDATIYVYHCKTGKLLEKLKGHGLGSINGVSWHPTQHSMFASCSDDGTIRIWRPHERRADDSTEDESVKALEMASQASNGHEQDYSMTQPSPFPWSNSPRSPGSPPRMPTLGRMEEAILRSTGEPRTFDEGDEEEEDGDDDDDDDDDEEDEDVMAE